MHTPVDAERLDVVTHTGMELVFSGVMPSPSPMGVGASALPNFGVLLYLCLHSLTDDDIRQDNA